MTHDEKKRYIRLIYSRTLRCFGVGLAISAVAGGLYGDGIYTVYALCAAGACMLCWAWFTHLKASGIKPFCKKPGGGKRRVPYLYQRIKHKKPARPSFCMDSTDFDDDLTSATIVSEEPFTKVQIDRARITARCAAGALLIAVSFFLINLK